MERSRACVCCLFVVCLLSKNHEMKKLRTRSRADKAATGQMSYIAYFLPSRRMKVQKNIGTPGLAFLLPRMIIDARLLYYFNQIRIYYHFMRSSIC